MDLHTLTIEKALELLAKKEITAPQLAKAYLDVIAAKDGDIHAYLEVYKDVMAQAEEIQKKIDAGTAGPLAGIPIAIKDNILIKGKVASSASKILENYVASYDATVIEKLKKADVVFIGRTNMDEFAMGGSTENSGFGPTKNPVDTACVPGGSSGGSAAAVAMDGALVALGSDTGGSIRQPAGFCGVVGLKPTYGSVSRHGLMAMASSLDVIGPIAKTVADAELVYNVIKGKDPMDSTSVEGESPKKEVKVIGVPRSFLEKGVDADVLANFNESIEKLKAEGYEIKDIELPLLPYALAVYYILMPAEVSSNLARFDGVRYGSLKEGNNLLEDYMLTRGEFLGKEARRRIILGTYVLSTGYYDAFYNKAWQVRKLITEDFNKAFADVDVIATPVSPTPAFKLNERSQDPLQMYLADIFTVGPNLAGIPAISVPSGFAKREEKELPLGIHFMAPAFGEQLLFEIGKKFEKIGS